MIVIGWQKEEDEQVVDVVFEEHEERADAIDALERLQETEADLTNIVNYFWAIKNENGYKIMAIQDKTIEDQFMDAIIYNIYLER